MYFSDMLFRCKLQGIFQFIVELARGFAPAITTAAAAILTTNQPSANYDCANTENRLRPQPGMLPIFHLATLAVRGLFALGIPLPRSTNAYPADRDGRLDFHRRRRPRESRARRLHFGDVISDLFFSSLHLRVDNRKLHSIGMCCCAKKTLQN